MALTSARTACSHATLAQSTPRSEQGVNRFNMHVGFYRVDYALLTATILKSWISCRGSQVVGGDNAKEMCYQY